MAKRNFIEESGYVETGTYKLSELYSKFIIFPHLINFEKYSEIAYYGTGELIEEFMLNEETKIKARINALRRLATELITLFGNCEFQIDKKYLDQIRECKEGVKKISVDLIPRCYKTITTLNNSGQTKQKQKINEKLFKQVLNILIEIKDWSLIPLNKSGLIFWETDDMSIDELKDSIKKRVIEQG